MDSLFTPYTPETLPDGFLPAAASSLILDALAGCVDEAGTIDIDAVARGEFAERVLAVAAPNAALALTSTPLRAAVESVIAVLDAEGQAVAEYADMYAENDGREVAVDTDARDARRTYWHASHRDRAYWHASLASGGMIETETILSTRSMFAIQRHLTLRNLRGNDPRSLEYEDD